MKLAVIPARGGSKRIPRKNIKPFCGKPMIAWSIEAALQSGCFDQVIVSTDDDLIGETARYYGAIVPFMRPAELSDDLTGTIPVIRHAIEWYNTHVQLADQVCCLYATAPFVTADDLCRGLNILTDTGCDYAFSVTSYAFPIQRAIRITADNRVEMFDPAHFNTRSQDLEEAWFCHWDSIGDAQLLTQESPREKPGRWCGRMSFFYRFIGDLLSFEPVRGLKSAGRTVSSPWIPCIISASRQTAALGAKLVRTPLWLSSKQKGMT